MSDVIRGFIVLYLLAFLACVWCFLARRALLTVEAVLQAFSQEWSSIAHAVLVAQRGGGAWSNIGFHGDASTRRAGGTNSTSTHGHSYGIIRVAEAEGSVRRFVSARRGRRDGQIALTLFVC
jgi:hypothetical protein